MNVGRERDKHLHWLFVLLALIFPALAVYDVYYQLYTPTVDFATEKGDTPHAGYVVPGGRSEAAGLAADNRILAVDGIPLESWHASQLGQTHTLVVERDGRQLTFDMPAVSIGSISHWSWIVATVVALVFWGVACLLLWRRFCRQDVRLVETLRRQLDEMRASQETLTQAQRQLLCSYEDERGQLARDLHDGPVQTLVTLNLQLGLLLPAVGNDTALENELQAMRGEVRSLLGELRRVCAELRPPMLDLLGLGAALRALAEDWAGQSGVAVDLDLPPDAMLTTLPGEVAVNLYRVAQEALSNTARHAKATKATIGLHAQDGLLVLSIRDDGRGFAVPATLHDLAAQDHFGLVGIQERVRLIDGRCTIKSAPGQGTIVEVTWPGSSTPT